MLKKYRGPVLAFGAAIVLLAIVLVTRPTSPVSSNTGDSSGPTSTSVPLLPTNTPLPTLIPATPIPFQDLDTATLHEAVVGCFKKLNPLLAGYNQPDLDASSLIFEGLTTTNEYGAAIPNLASWTVSNDGLIYVFKLRSDVLWQDGQPLTSADVLFTIHMMQDPAFPGRPDLHTFWQTVDVDALDAHTVRFVLAQPLAAFPDYLRIGLLPEHALKGTPAGAFSTHPFNLAPIGTGPYQFDGLIGTTSTITGLRLRLSATYRQRPEGKDGYALQEIVFHCTSSFNDAMAAFQHGDVSSVSELPADTLKQVADLTQLTVHTAYRPAFGAVIYNWQRDQVAFFRDFRMRQALARSVDRTTLVGRYLDGRAVPADSPILPSSWAYTPSVTCPAFDPNNPDAAKTRLAQVQIQPIVAPAGTQAAAAAAGGTAAAPAPVGPVSPSDFKFTLLVSNDPALAGLAGEIVKSWNALGPKVTLTVVDASTFKSRLVAGNFDAALAELDMAPNADPDPYSLWRQRPDEGGLNFGGLNERRISELVEAARQEVNGAHRAQLYQQFQQLFCDQAAALLLYYPVYAYGTDSRLAGVQLGFMADPSERFRTLQSWHFVQS